MRFSVGFKQEEQRQSKGWRHVVELTEGSLRSHVLIFLALSQFSGTGSFLFKKKFFFALLLLYKTFRQWQPTVSLVGFKLKQLPFLFCDFLLFLETRVPWCSTWSLAASTSFLQHRWSQPRPHPPQGARAGWAGQAAEAAADGRSRKLPAILHALCSSSQNTLPLPDLSTLAS